MSQATQRTTLIQEVRGSRLWRPTGKIEGLRLSAVALLLNRAHTCEVAFQRLCSVCPADSPGVFAASVDYFPPVRSIVRHGGTAAAASSRMTAQVLGQARGRARDGQPPLGPHGFHRPSYPRARRSRHSTWKLAAPVSEGLNFVICPDYSLSSLRQFCLAVRARSQGKKYKALLINGFAEFADLLESLGVQHGCLAADGHFHGR